MSKIAEQIEKLREQEKRLHRETRKVEFLTHILVSAREYEHEDFKDVKEDVVQKLELFVNKTIEAIEAGTVVTISVGATTSTPAAPAAPQQQAQVQAATPTQPKVQELSIAEKTNFALDNRHLGGKMVTVANDQNVTIRGKVVGLDAPYVLVKTDTGPTIKAPLDKVSLA